MFNSLYIRQLFFRGGLGGRRRPWGERVYNTLIGCEIISEEDSAEMDQPVTRKEAAELMIRLQFLESAAGALAGTSQFLDVVPSDPYAPYIALCSDLGIISGDGDGYFRPDEPLLLEEGTKLLVSCLAMTPLPGRMEGSRMDICQKRNGFPYSMG